MNTQRTDFHSAGVDPRSRLCISHEATKGTKVDAGLKEAFVAIVPLCEIELGCEPLALRQANVEPDAFVEAYRR